mmetsp:Transcript_12570/g.24587  ORF Transcript_12570/g.24587 Transcript_12570/m.24587 type:complete len:363 (+) Transcript_12570:63-1151(+)
MGQSQNSSTASIAQCAFCVHRDLDDRAMSDFGTRPEARRTNPLRVPIETVYTFESGQLGSGSVATVRKARRRHCWDIVRAVKQVDKARVKCRKTVGREIGILMTLDHPNICKMFESYVDYQSIHLVMEFLEGHDLQREIDENIRLKRHDETRYSAIVSQLLDAVRYCHDVGVVHRDLRPGHVIVCDTIDYAFPVTKLIDFGLALEGPPHEGHNTGRLEGSMAYLAPEVHHATIYSEASDMYSIGVIMFVMLLERFPSNNVQNDILDIESPDGRDLVSGLLKRDPRLRMIAAQAAKHPWTQQHKGIRESSVRGAMKPSGEAEQLDRWLSDLSDLSRTKSGSALHDVAGISTEEFDGMLVLGDR